MEACITIICRVNRMRVTVMEPCSSNYSLSCISVRDFFSSLPLSGSWDDLNVLVSSQTLKNWNIDTARKQDL